MSYGVFQEFYSEIWNFHGNKELTGVIGTTSNGIMYLSMPFLFALFTKRWARYRQVVAVCGALLACVSFVLSAFSTQVWQLVATQGVLASFGCALVYSPVTLSLGEWFNNSKRAVAYGIAFSIKNIVGAICPFMFRGLLDRYGLKMTLIIFAAMSAGSGIPAIFLVPTHPFSLLIGPHRSRKLPWQFLRHRAFYIYSVAIILQSSGYGIPRTYLNTYAHDIAHVSRTSATLLLTLFNAPGIASSTIFGWLSDNKRFRFSIETVTSISAVSTALSVFLFWGLSSQGSMAILVLFSVTFGFFAGGYSATWGGMLNKMEHDAAQRNEAIDIGMIYGLLNGARGIGYVSGGLAGVPLLKIGASNSLGSLGYGTTYGPLIILTGLSTIFVAWGLLWKWRDALQSITSRMGTR
ncbi:hypothetical protein BLS_001155 [Venturia inaequalis]|uniref:Major facilitator superfamily (MFS) profile domain-containing protein n=1 Tax=Venturia inaequalis TaxID=5025 RepID=A0A8H3U277_VENIN|nr:hypothetical protein BLS_001155 [Venturia inaequalis]